MVFCRRVRLHARTDGASIGSGSECLDMLQWGSLDPVFKKSGVLGKMFHRAALIVWCRCSRLPRLLVWVVPGLLLS
jgi:hypothetical protein